jgi:hypothetical protein
MHINGDGFEPDSNIAWKLVDSNQTIPIFGYFTTNTAGGFTETLTLDDIPEGHYKIYFAPDANFDGSFDSASSNFVEVDIPCSEGAQGSVSP